MPDDTMVLPTLVGPEQGVATCHRQTVSQDRILLDGTWDFLHLIEDYRSGPVGWRSIQVPGPWQAQFAELRMRGGTGIYRRQVEIPAGWKRRRIFLTFGAVFHITRAWVNGELVGWQIGGFLPFSFDVTEQLVEGVNELKVRVDSPMDDPNEYPEAPFAEIPFGKQSWYGPLSGIWQSVWLEPRPVDHITRARITPQLATGRVGVSAFFAQRSTRTITRIRSAQPRRPSFSKTNFVRPRNSGSTACGVTSRRPTRDTTRLPTGWVC